MKPKNKLPKSLTKLTSKHKSLRKEILNLDRPAFEKFKDSIRQIGHVIVIHGVEITQGMQSYRASEHLTGIPGQRQDNTVRFVSGKPAWVRVYVRNLFFPVFSNISGSLKIYKRRFGRFYSEIAELVPENPGVVDAPMNADYATERGSLDHTLNFIVPAALMCGNLRFDVEINFGSLKDTSSHHVNAIMQQTLNARIIPVSYSGPDGSGGQMNLPATSLADAQSTAALCMAFYPVQSTPNITLTAAVQLTFPLTGAPNSPGGCAQSWISLNALLAMTKAADGNLPQTFYYGLVPSAVPIGVNSGCASSGVTSGRVNDQGTMAHEFGHGLGFGHSNCGNVGNSADPNVPPYPPYDPPNISMGSIGEYGLDVRTGEIYDPNITRDYMSYCGNNWISLFNYERSIQHGRFRFNFSCNDRPIFDFNRPVLEQNPVFTGVFPLPDPPPDRPPWYDDYVQQPISIKEQVVSIIAIEDITGQFELCSMTQVLAHPVIEDGSPSGMIACLYDKENTLLSSAPLYYLKSEGHSNCGCGGSGDDRHPEQRIVQAMIPKAEGVGSLRIIKEDKEVWVVKRPRATPKSPNLEATMDDDGSITITWKTTKSAGPTEVWLQWLDAEIDEPKVLLIGKETGSYNIPPGSIPPGKGVFRAVNHNGFAFAVSKDVEFEIPEGPPSVAILHPYHHQSLAYGRSMRLHGLASDSSGKPINPQLLCPSDFR